MKDIKIFEKKKFGKIRIIENGNKPLLVASDVAKILGYKDTTSAIKRHCRWVVKRHIPHPQNPAKSIQVNAIPEGDIYRLITHSELPDAEEFEAWVFDEVLPDIRKHGMYAKEELLNNPDLLIEVAMKYKEEKQRRLQVERQSTALQAELDYSKEWYSIKRVAAINGVPWQTFDWKRLKSKGYELGYQPKKIFDANYGEVNTYHKNVWENVYPEYEI